jgi:hypothetical protein
MLASTCRATGALLKAARHHWHPLNVKEIHLNKLIAIIAALAFVGTAFAQAPAPKGEAKGEVKAEAKKTDKAPKKVAKKTEKKSTTTKAEKATPATPAKDTGSKATPATPATPASPSKDGAKK